MVVRTVKIDIEKILDDLWMYFTSDIQASLSACDNKLDLDEFLHEDRLKAKCKLEALKDCTIIDVEEYNKMRAKIDAEAENIRIKFENRITENKED